MLEESDVTWELIKLSINSGYNAPDDVTATNKSIVIASEKHKPKLRVFQRFYPDHEMYRVVVSRCA